MENTKTREQSVDTDPMYDNREVVTDAEAEMEREQTADNMSEDDAPETDKSAETAGAQSAGDGSLSDVERQWQDKYLRLVAEFDNYRKRTTREKENAYADAKADTIKPFLDVLDNLERGTQQFEEGDPHRQGMEMICKQFSAVLEKLGVAQIPAQDQPFDPQKHNAVMHVEDESVGENTIVEVFQQGYELGDKVLRFAMVKVAN